jgi:hypothetical protein
MSMTTVPQLAQGTFPQYLAVAVLASLLASCGGGSGGTTAVEKETIAGQVFDGYIEGALVCLDLNGNGKCDQGEAQTRSDAAGKFQLTIPKDSAAPLAAEVIAGQSRDADEQGSTVDRSYRMVSPAREYSTNITPFTTLVHLSGERNFKLAEELVRNDVGLPPRFDINAGTPAVAGSLTHAVAKSIVIALKATAVTVDFSSTDALAKVVAAFPVALTALPELRIDTKNSAPIVSKEDYVDATFLLTNPAGASQPASLNGKMRGRGHSTWGQPKNPYKVVFSNDAKLAALPDVVGMKKSRYWVLLADYFDRSLLRNKLAFSLGSSSVFSDGLAWNPSGQHVEVYLNEDYVGVYLLAEDIRVDPDRLNIKKMSSSTTVNDVDGGYIVEVDWRLDCYNQGAINLQYVTGQAVPFCIDTPDEGSITQNQIAYIKGLLGDVEQDLYVRGNLTRINVESFVDWYLLSELFKNNDAVFFSSVFMWKDTDAAATPRNRLLNLGPIWDFDISAGNVNYNDNWLAEGCWVVKPSLPNWIARLFDNPAFLDMAIARWKQKRPALGTFVNSSIDTYARRLALAEQRNFTRWPILGAPLTNHYVFYTYADEVAFLKAFLDTRMAWLDRAFESPASFNAMCK